jgi:hypothetical protein
MTEFISTYFIDLNDLTIKYKEVTDYSDWGNLICEHDGFFTDSNSIEFDYNGTPFVVNFDLSVEGFVESYPGDYYTPDSDELIISEVNIDITDIYFDDYELEVTKDFYKILESKILKIVS